MAVEAKLGKCEIEGCNEKAKYGIFWPRLDGKKGWLYVCRLHERVIGNENLRRAGGRYERVEGGNYGNHHDLGKQRRN